MLVGWVRAHELCGSHSAEADRRLAVVRRTCVDTRNAPIESFSPATHTYEGVLTSTNGIVTNSPANGR